MSVGPLDVRPRLHPGALLAAHNAVVRGGSGRRAQARAERAPRTAPGLVSVPTSGTRQSKPSSVVAEVAERIEELGGFCIDKDASRLARLRMAVGFSARLHCAASHGFRPDRVVMVTLTYRPGVEWSPKHVSEAVRRMRQWLNRRGVACRYVWVAELQKRGAVHYHLAVWLPHGCESLPFFDACGWWPHGMTNNVVARHAVAYLMKYMSKGLGASDFSLPGGARCYGVGGLDVSEKRSRAWLRRPSFLRAFPVEADCRRVPGGGWSVSGVSLEGVIHAGERFCSEFTRSLVSGVPVLLRVARHLVGDLGDGPFSLVRFA